MPQLDAFIESIIHEQDKFINISLLNSSNARALAMHEKGKPNSKPNQQSKHKGKARDIDPRKGGNTKSPNNYVGNNNKRGGGGESVLSSQIIFHFI